MAKNLCNLDSLGDAVQFWNNMIKLPRKKMIKMNNENVTIAEKIALFDCNVWPKWYFGDDTYAQEQRIIGNEHFVKREFQLAINAYNECVHYSSSIEFRGIAYANRAAAYHGLRCFQDCLDSILLAKECPLPAKTMEKVLAREKIATEGLKLQNFARGENVTDLPIALSYRRNKRMPTFVFCLRLKDAKNPYGGIITTENLFPGDILVIEPPLTTFTRALYMCNNCLSICGSLQPCECGIFFCSLKCKTEAFETYHKFECPLGCYLRAFSDEDCLVMRVFFKLIQRFKDFASFREYLETIKAPNPFENDDFKAWPDAGSFEAQFRLYYATEVPSVKGCTVSNLNLFRGGDDYQYAHTCMAKAAIIIDILKLSKNIPSVATDTEEWTFLSEQLFRLFFYKSFSEKSVVSSKIKYVQDANNGIMMTPISYVKGALALFGSASLFKTSCEANVDFDYEKDFLIVRAKRCIPRGTELLAHSSTANHNAYTLQRVFPPSSLNFRGACFCANCYTQCLYVFNIKRFNC